MVRLQWYVTGAVQLAELRGPWVERARSHQFERLLRRVHDLLGVAQPVITPVATTGRSRAYRGDADLWIWVEGDRATIENSSPVQNAPPASTVDPVSVVSPHLGLAFTVAWACPVSQDCGLQPAAESRTATDDDFRTTEDVVGVCLTETEFEVRRVLILDLVPQLPVSWDGWTAYVVDSPPRQITDALTGQDLSERQWFHPFDLATSPVRPCDE